MVSGALRIDGDISRDIGGWWSFVLCRGGAGVPGGGIGKEGVRYTPLQIFHLKSIHTSRYLTLPCYPTGYLSVGSLIGGWGVVVGGGLTSYRRPLATEVTVIQKYPKYPKYPSGSPSDINEYTGGETAVLWING